MKLTMAEFKGIRPAIERLSLDVATLSDVVSSQQSAMTKLAENQDMINSNMKVLASEMTKLQQGMHMRIQRMESKLGPLARIQRVEGSSGLEFFACPDRATTC